MHPSFRRCVFLCLLALLPLAASARAQGTVPTFRFIAGQHTLTVAGRDPAQGGTITLPTLLVPVSLTVEGTHTTSGEPFVMSAAGDVPRLLASPLFTRYAFPTGGTTQFTDAMLRTTFPGRADWHTLLARPAVQPMRITIPAGYGYVLTSKRDGGAALAVVDADYVQQQIFRQLPKRDGQLVIAFTHNTTFYVDGDATVCCATGTHGVDRATGASFVLGSYLHDAPAVSRDQDVQPLSEQLAEFFVDPLHDPAIYGYDTAGTGNAVPPWRAGEGCGGVGIGSAYFQLEPTDTNHKNNIPASMPFAAGMYHLQNVALLPWYLGAEMPGRSTAFSFPDAHALAGPAQPCTMGRRHRGEAMMPTAVPAPENKAPNGHRLIGYYNGSSSFRLTDIAPQWDTIIVAFAAPVKDAPEGTLAFHPPDGITPQEFAAEVAAMKHRGKKVMISLGGGGAFFSLKSEAQIAHFVACVSGIVKQYGFDGVDIDFESPSLVLDPGDTDFRHPTTPSVAHLIAGLRQLHDRFGPGFMISLVPEGSQIPGGFAGYGGQFGSYLPLVYGLRDILSFVDVQDYNTPPLEGLDGEIYQTDTVDYHAAMTELLLHGFAVGGDPKRFFPPVPADKVAVGFLTGYSSPDVVQGAMQEIITGKAPAGTTYKLRQGSGYPGMIGAMFWTIDDDRRGNYRYSNTVGPQLHGYSIFDNGGERKVR